MKGDIRAPRYRKGTVTDSRLTVQKLTLDAQVAEEWFFLAAISQAMFPFGERDKAFDRWLLPKAKALMKEYNARIKEKAKSTP